MYFERIENASTGVPNEEKKTNKTNSHENKNPLKTIMP